MFSLTFLASLGFGIGANVILFSVANSLFFRSISPVEPEKVLFLYTSYKDDLKWGSTSYPDFMDLRTGVRSFASLSCERIAALSLGTDTFNQRITGSLVSASYFRTLGVSARLGRVFDDRGEPEGAVLLLSHQLWRQSFGADPGVLGRKVPVNGVPFTVIGVMPEEFRGAVVGYEPRFWIPIESESLASLDPRSREERRQRSLFVVGRLQGAATMVAAKAELDQLAAHLEHVHPKTNTGISFTVIPAAEGALHPLYRPTLKMILVILFAVVGIILLTVCTNLASLLLARSQARRQEISIRLALGSSRMSLFAQLLTDSLLLSLLGAGLALGLAALATRMVESLFALTELPIGLDLSLDHRVFVFTLGMAVLSGLAVGLIPAVQSARESVAEVIRESAQSQGSGPARLRKVFLFCQTALSLVLIVAAALLLKGLSRARTLDPGFVTERIATAAVDLGVRSNERAEGTRLQRDLIGRMAALSQVEGVSLASHLPLDPFGAQRDVLSAEAGGEWQKRLVSFAAVSPGYFSTLGIRILRGRDFDAHDTAGTRPVVLVNEQLAARYWPGVDPVGRAFRTSGKEYVIVGVVADTRNVSLAEPAKPFFYVSLFQEYFPMIHVLARTRGLPQALYPALRSELRTLDPSLSLFKARSLEQHLEGLLLIPRIGATILSGFGLFAVALAGLGLYGALAYAISRRTREIGIRLALGATRASILHMVVGEGMRVAVPAVLCGLVLAAGVTRSLQQFLFGVSPWDPVSFLGASVLLLAVTALSSALSARRSLSIEATAALKDSAA